MLAVDGDCPDGYFWVTQDSTCQPKKFTITIKTNSANEGFTFYIAATGTFYVDWGDGTTQKWAPSNTNSASHPHTYANAGTYKVTLSGQATGYPTSETSSTSVSAFYVSSNSRPILLEGSLGQVFPTIGTGDTLAKQPRFYQTFRLCSNLKGPIPSELFSGVHGTPAPSQFSYLFSGCTALNGSIPSDLFSGISGPISNYTFNRTFENCSNLTGTIPENLFSNVSGAATYMFNYTFAGCSKLSGPLPANLFKNLSGTPKQNMFSSTFSGCTNIDGYIPEGFFGNLSGTPIATSMVTDIFKNTGLGTTCPDNTEEITLQFTKTQLSGKAACRALNAPCGWTSGLTFSTGQTFSAFTQKTTSAALGIKYNNSVCYIPLSSGIGTAGTLNFSTNNGATTYHATPN